MSLPSPASPRWVAIQRNLRSGSGRGSRELIRLVHRLKWHGFTPRLFSRRSDLDRFVRQTVEKKEIRAIVAAGGDGTLLDVANRFPDIPLAMLPLGTENLFARAAGLPRRGAELADLIAAGRTRRFDCAQVNGRRFLVIASAGFDAEVIHVAHSRRTGRIRRWFYAIPIAVALFRYSFPMFQVQLDDEGPPVTACLVLMANHSKYALGIPIAPQACGDDGLLDICVFQSPGRWRLFRDLMDVLRGAHQLQPHVLMRKARRVVLTSDQPVPVQIDGDPGGFLPARVEVEPAAIEVFVKGSG